MHGKQGSLSRVSTPVKVDNAMMMKKIATSMNDMSCQGSIIMKDVNYKI
jgi:hypothetical protein